MFLLWGLFIIVMSLAALNREIDTFHYILFSLVMLYFTYIYKQL